MMRDESPRTRSALDPQRSSSLAETPQSPKRYKTPATGHVQVFAIYDVDNDGDLYDQLDTQSHRPGCRFDLAGGSEDTRDSETWRERVRRQVRDADQIIVICGEHTEASPRIHTEFQIALEEDKPYFLLWGRRGINCTKPLGAKPTDGMYSWSGPFLDDQIALNLRRATTDEKARSLRRASPGD